MGVATGFAAAMVMRGNRLAGRLACVTLEAAADSPPLAHIHSHPPVEPFQHLNSVSDAEMAGSVRVAYVQYPRPRLEGHAHSDRLITERAR